MLIGGLVETARVENYFIKSCSHEMEWRRASYLKGDGPLRHPGQMILHCFLQNCEHKSWREPKAVIIDVALGARH